MSSLIEVMFQIENRVFYTEKLKLIG